MNTFIYTPKKYAIPLQFQAGEVIYKTAFMDKTQ
jgi:hypothetical protein